MRKFLRACWDVWTTRTPVECYTFDLVLCQALFIFTFIAMITFGAYGRETEAVIFMAFAFAFVILGTFIEAYNRVKWAEMVEARTHRCDENCP
jgi:hypothetical protein